VTAAVRRRLLQGASFVLAAGLLGLALYGVDMSRIVEAFRDADYWWLIPLTALVLGSNVCRAWRWNVLIDALPTTSNPTAGLSGNDASKNTLEASFSSVMIGYMVNYVAPRMGEVARTANMAARTPFQFSSLFGTVVSERIFDTTVLGLALLSAIGLLIDRLGILRTQFFEPAWTQISTVSVEWVVGGMLVLFLLTVASRRFLQSLDREHSAVLRFWTNTVKPALTSFRRGMWTLLRSPRRAAILLSTAGMWGGYLLMAYIPFRMLDLAGPYGIGIGDAWAIMAIGALGILVPTPGGVGSYHYITEQALVHLYGVPSEEALTYAVLTHAAQFLFYTVVGVVALLYQGTGTEVLFPSQPEGAAPISEDKSGP